MNLKISKPKTRPIQIEPWFFKYLNPDYAIRKFQSKQTYYKI